MTDAREELKRRLKEHGFKMTSQREKVFELLQRQGGHLSSDEIFAELRKKYPGLGRATVYRTLKLLAEANVASRVQLEDRKTCFEHVQGHHDHFYCVRCKRSFDFLHPGIEKLQQQVARKYGFKILHHRLQITGVCKECQ